MIWNSMGRRHLTLASAALAAMSVVSAQAEELTVVGWGGALSAAEKQAFEVPFAKETGVTVNAETYNGGLAQVKAQIEQGNVIWDVLDAEMTDAELGCSEGILEEISADELATAPDGSAPGDDFFESALHDCGVANYVWATVYAFDSTKLSDKPSRIGDLFDVAGFPGKRGLRRSPKVNMEWALMADGVSKDRVYEILTTPEGVDRAFAQLDKIKDHVIWWETGAQPPQMLADGEVVMTSAYNGRLFNAIVKENQPFQIVWDGQVWDYGAFIVPKGTPNRERALEFVKFATSAERLADLTNYISYGPARRSGVALVSDGMQKHLPTSDENFKHGLRADAEFWADYGEELTERFNAWLVAN